MSTIPYAYLNEKHIPDRLLQLITTKAYSQINALIPTLSDDELTRELDNKQSLFF